MTTFSYTTGNPANLTGGAPAAMNDIQGPFTDLRTFLNGGNIDATNLANLAVTTAKIADSAVTTAKIADSSVTDAKLSNPNNAVWRTLAETPFSVTASVPAGTYHFQIGGNWVASGSSGPPFPVNLDPAEYVVAGKTAKLRLRVNLAVGGAPGIAPVFGIYSIAALGGTTGVTVTLGAVVPSSTAAFAGLVTAGVAITQASGAFDFPASGQYLFGVNLPSPTAANSVMVGRMQLSISHV